jgi:putative DNA primase/helicase
LWTDDPNRNLGIATGTGSGLLVLDVDGPAGLASVNGRALPTTPTVATHKGRHYYYKHPPGMAHTTRTGLLNGVDVRGEGGYVVAPPSIHPSGAQYTWIEGAGPDLALAETPAWLIEMLTDTPPPSVASVDPGPTERIQQGARNATLFRRGAALRRKGLELAQIEAVLQEHNRRLCEPPLPHDEVARIARSAGSYDAGRLWPAPKSLTLAALPEADYPLHAFPQIAAEAIAQYQGFGGQPIPLVACSALSTMSVSTQGLANVSRDEVLTGPISLNVIVLANSGERKTSCDRVFVSSVKQWELDRAAAMKDSIAKSIAALEAWEVEHQGVQAAIKRAVMRGEKAKAEALRDQLLQHAIQRPHCLIAPRILYEDTTPEALADRLQHGHASAALWSDEGGLFFGGHGMSDESAQRNMGQLNRFWDGGSVKQDRKMAPSVYVDGRRLSTNIMVQPAVFDDFMDRMGHQARGIGFLGRCLMAFPLTTMGTRMYKPAPAIMDKMQAFHARVRLLLDIPFPLDSDGRLAPPVLPLSRAAKVVWVKYHDTIERALAPAGQFDGITDFAAKSAEQAARIAACFHLFEGGSPTGEIAEATLLNASVVAHWHLSETLRITGLVGEPEDMRLARKLDTWLRKQVGPVPLEDSLQRTPGPLRKAATRDKAMAVLEELHRARFSKDDNGVTVIEVNPALLDRTAT